MFLKNLKLNTRIVLLFLVIALIPLAIFGFILLQTFRSSVSKEKLLDLSGRMELKKSVIELWIKEKRKDVANVAASLETAKALGALAETYESSGYSSNAYIQTLAVYDRHYKNYTLLYNFDDVLMISAQGDVIYSAARESDYKTNILRDGNSKSTLADAYRNSMRGAVYISDYTDYNTIGNKYVMFLSSPVEAAGKIIGVIIIRLKTETISDLMNVRTGMGVTGETLIIGKDFLMRSDSRLTNKGQSDIMKTKIETTPVKEAFAGLPMSGQETDYRGEPVLIVTELLDLEGLNWVIEAKIDVKEALATITKTQNLLFLLLTIISVIVFALAWFFGRTISQPIKDMSEMAKKLALGDLDHNLKPKGDDEIGQLWQSLNGVIESQRQVSDAAIAIAQGDVSIYMTERSGADVMSRAMNQMVSILKDTITQAKAIATGDFTTTVTVRSEKDQLNVAIQSMNKMLFENKLNTEQQNWLQEGVMRINDLLIGEDNTESIASNVLSEIAQRLDTKIGAFYIVTEDEKGPLLKLQGTYAYTRRKNLSNIYRLGEGLIGQAALEMKQILVQNVPEDYIRVVSGLGESVPRNICVTPFLFKGNLKGVIEFGTLEPLGTTELLYLEQISGPIGIAFEMAKNQSELRSSSEGLRSMNEELYEQARSLEQSEQELKNQQTELETINTELNSQMLRVKESEEKLKEQQEELEVSNSELISKNSLLEKQKAEIELARQNIVKQSEEVSLANKHKTNFLANMSHELRTPLNSLLLLSRSLKENKEGNLNEDEVESASVIYDSGSDLLNLINEILDLSKIEAGRMDINLSAVSPEEIERQIMLQFSHMAENQGLLLEVLRMDSIPEIITTDYQLLSQVMKNLISNAIKFTENGKISVIFSNPKDDVIYKNVKLRNTPVIAISVIDTGIGIPDEKLSEIFEAFKQLDSGDQKRYKGTGLGLTISRDLIDLIGGEIQVKSETGLGSTFTIYIPVESVKIKEAKADSDNFADLSGKSQLLTFKPEAEKVKITNNILVPDDRDSLLDNDRVILLIEDDVRFLKILCDYVRKRGFKCLNSTSGEEGLELANEYKPDGVILDIQLPGMDGWSVLNLLKQDVSLRHIPVHIVSVEEANIETMNKGAIGQFSKPINSEQISQVLERIEAASALAPKRVLVIEDDEIIRKETVRIVGNGNVSVDEVATGKDALEALSKQKYDLAILDLGLPDMQGLELLKRAVDKNIPLPSIIIHTVRELTVAEELTLRNYADSIIIKDVRSQERLIDEIALFLHRVVRDLSEENRQAIMHLRESDEPLRGKKVLIVEDDMRTMFAMARLLAGHGMNPIKAENGKRALDLLEENPDVKIILMDIMMPVMNGYEAIKNIRSQNQFVRLPIIALTAKAMKEDRMKCLDAGATDYLSKPINPDRLTSLMRVLLCR
ncbi:MAG: response regulator [Bacteroidales bacterium]